MKEFILGTIALGVMLIAMQAHIENDLHRDSLALHRGEACGEGL